MRHPRPSDEVIRRRTRRFAALAWPFTALTLIGCTSTGSGAPASTTPYASAPASSADASPEGASEEPAAPTPPPPTATPAPSPTAIGQVFLDFENGRIAGMTEFGQEIWHLLTPGDYTIEVAAGGVAIVTYTHPDDDRWPQPKVLKAIDTATGAVLWEDDRSSMQTVFAETVYTTTCDGRQDGQFGNCELSARDPRDGDARWTIATEASARVMQDVTGMDNSDDPHMLAPPEPAVLILKTYPTGHASETARTVEAATGHWLPASFEGHDKAIISGKALVSVGHAGQVDENCLGTVRAWDLGSGSSMWERPFNVPLHPPQNAGGDPECHDFSGKVTTAGRLMVTAGDGPPETLDLATGETVPEAPAQ